MVCMVQISSMENKMANERIFCAHGNAFVIPNAYNNYVEDTDRCRYVSDRTFSVCKKCCMVLRSSRVR